MAQANYREFTEKEVSTINDMIVGLNLDPPTSFSGWEPKRLWHHPESGPFEECAYSEGFDSRFDGRSLVPADFDNDGDLDLVMLNRAGQRLQYFENTGSGGNVVELELIPHSGPREADAVLVRADGLGVFTTALARGFASSVPPVVHLGLGARKSIDVEVQWRDGTKQKVTGLAAGARHQVEQGKPKPVKSTPFAPKAAPPKLPWPGTLSGLGFEKSNKPTVVQLFLKSCKACGVEAPKLSALNKSGRAVVRGLGMGPEGESLEVTAKSLHVDYPFLPLSEPLADALSTAGELPLPLLLVYGADGNLARVLRGPGELESVLRELAGKP
ncbi:MAG: CRTAC1 family protein [Myxococcaceae bacterium]